MAQIDEWNVKVLAASRPRKPWKIEERKKRERQRQQSYALKSLGELDTVHF
jgi:hypothetical protein